MTTSATISPFPIVQQGDSDHPVKTLQYLLRERGHTVDVDGIFGPETDAAVRAFQTAENLAVDGDRRPEDLVRADRHRAQRQHRRRGARRAGGVPVPPPASPARGCRSTASSGLRPTPRYVAFSRRCP